MLSYPLTPILIYTRREYPMPTRQGVIYVLKKANVVSMGTQKTFHTSGVNINDYMTQKNCALQGSYTNSDDALNAADSLLNGLNCMYMVEYTDGSAELWH